MAFVPRTISRVEFIALIAAVSTINSAAIDVMLPALPAMGTAFDVANPNDRSLVLTAFLIGMGLPQLIFGPLVDRFGRRGPMLLGLAAYALMALAAPLAPNFGVLLLCRFIQGAGSSAVAVAAQATVRDRYSGRAMAEVMSLVYSVFMIVPVLAPVVGQVILLTGPWQVIFLFMGVVGIVFAAWAYFRLAESLPAANRRPLTFRIIAEGFGLVVGNRMALFYGLSSIFLFGAVLGFVNTAQQIYVDIYGLGALFPLAFAVGPIFFAASFMLNSRLVARFGMRRLAHGAMLIYLGVTALWLALSYVGLMPLWLFLVLLAATTLAQGFVWGNVGSLAMEPLGAVAGTASAVFGAFGAVGAAALAYVIAQLFDGTTTPVIGAYFVFGVLVLGCFLIAERGRLFRSHTGAATETSLPV